MSSGSMMFTVKFNFTEFWNFHNETGIIHVAASFSFSFSFFFLLLLLILMSFFLFLEQGEENGKL